MAAEISESDEQTVEYVELLDVPVYNEHTEIITINAESEENVNDDESGTENILQEVVTTEEDVYNEDETVEYIEAKEVALQCGDINFDDDEQQTIIVHDGRQYVIPTEQLNSDVHTIVLEDEGAEDDDISYVVQKDQEDEEDTVYYAEMDATEVLEGDEETTLGRQYAVLRDGKLHIRESAGNPSTLTSTLKSDAAEAEDIEKKLRAFEHTLSSYETDSQEVTDADECASDDVVAQITGRNLITGQTISLSGFLEKIRKRSDPESILNSAVRRRPSGGNSSKNKAQQSQFVLVPPVNRRVVVGRTPDGRRLVGRILQIQKKVTQPQDLAAETQELEMRQRPRSSQITKQELEHTQIVEEIQDEEQQDEQEQQTVEISPASPTADLSDMPQNVVVKRRFVTREFLDENVARTLAGLMDLETVERSLTGRRLIVRHVQRRSEGGRALPGTRRIAYYCGRMRRAEGGAWQFVPDSQTSNQRNRSANGIDLGENSDSQQVSVKIDGSVVFGTLGGENDSTPPTCIPDNESPSEMDIDDEDEEPITLNLTVTQDEHGKKRTKVTIPQLAGAGYGAGQRSRGGRSLAPSDVEGGGGGGAHTCHVCGKRFHAAGSLRRHATVHNPSLRPLQCLACMARFTDESSLRKHMILHTGLRPFRCTTCGKCFAHRGDLNFHARMHDPIKRYRCDVCGKHFNRHSNMLRHAEIHKPNMRSSLGRNEVADAAEQDNEQGKHWGPPYICETCGCQYNFVSSLTRHIVNNHMNTALAETEAESGT